MTFEPKILGFLCNWCSYAGADLAGVSRVQYPPNMRVIRVMCSGRVDPVFIFKALLTGIDGVFVLGCHPGDCHYLEGNYEAEKKFIMVQKFLKIVDFDKRVRLDWVSASEGARFAKVVTEFVESIRKQGPSPLSGENIDQELFNNLKAMENSVSSDRIRALVGRQRKITEAENMYGEKVPIDEFNAIFDEAIHDEFVRQRILLSLSTKVLSVKDLATELKLDPSEILENMLILKSRGVIDYQSIDGNTPLYMRI
ncbi:MAG: hydrogenase iron-sulfur subunit [Candidatus Lokiarchaeota archaeon]|nr:hydrogenase iron-sulfur subunit [Candidatus Lokiarchaeota archaeon]